MVKTKRLETRVRTFMAVACAASLAACSSANESEFGEPNATGAAGSQESTGAGFANGGSADGGGGASNDAGGSCFAPVDMYVVLDRSGSMGADGPIGTTTSKWTRAITALSGYFNAQAAKDQAAAIQFFPISSHDAAKCTTGDGYDVAASPAVDFTTLPTNAFDAVLENTQPMSVTGEGLGTPTEAAIRGMTRFTSANRRPGHVTIGILITDGEPTKCNQATSFLSGLLDAHRADTTIRTYVIGMQGANFANLEQIAAGGGAPEHPDAVGPLTDACGGAAPCRAWNVGDGDPAAFQAALQAIQASADGCAPGGGTVNPPK